MTIRLTLVLVLLAGFALAFSKLAKHSDGTGGPGSPCAEWSNPDCRDPALTPPN